MRDNPRHVLSILASAVGHVVVLLTGLFDLTPESLDLEVDLQLELVEVDIIELDKLQGEEEKPAEPVQAPPQLPPEAPPLPPDPTAEKEKEQKKEEPEEPAEPKRDLGQKRSSVDELGPPNSRYHVLLSTRNVRKLPYAKLAMRTIEALPDYQFLVVGGGFDALKDFDHILIASPDLRSVTQSFLAVDYKVSRETMKERIEKACEADEQTVEWIDEGGMLRGNPKPVEGSDWDPRWFVLPSDDKVAFYLRKEFLPALQQEEAGEEKTTANFIARMTKLKKYAQRIPTAGVQFEAHDLYAAVKNTNLKQFELPDDLELTIEAQADPEVNLRMTFKSVVAAKQFMDWWEDGIKEDVSFAWGAIGSTIEATEMTRDGAEVRAWVELQRGQTEIYLQMAAKWSADFQARVAKKLEAEKKRAAEKAAAEQPSEEPQGAKQETPEPKQDVTDEPAPAPAEEPPPKPVQE